MRTALAVLLTSLASPMLASDFSLAFPVDCALGETCYIQQFMDRDPGPGAQDFTCGPLSYDGHQGTDIALPTLADMRAGVTVRAAAPGVVTGHRDGMRDVLYSDDIAAEVDGKDCGNGAVIDHGNGWVTQYCHLKRGTVRVKTGDQIKAGDALGLIGLSGRTQFPHLHLSVRKNGKHVDPFDGLSTAPCSEDNGHDGGLWDVDVPYVPGGFLDIGFADAVPSYSEVKNGTAKTTITQKSEAVVLFAFAFGSQNGDVIRLQTRGPAGVLFEHDVTLERPQAQFFRAVGKRMRAGIPSGEYLGTTRLLRNGLEIDRATVMMTVE